MNNFIWQPMIVNTNFFPWLCKFFSETINNACYSSFRIKAEKGAKKDGEIFDAKKEEYKPSEQRKADQGAVDTQVNRIYIFHPSFFVCSQH